jgi:[lysine-biosynthesis-protein LysW]--L-2-aminoadipate ligase
MTPEMKDFHGQVGILFDRLRWEEKELAREFEMRGIKADLIDAKTLTIDLNRSGGEYRFPPVILERCVSYHRGFNLATTLESAGAMVVNSSNVLEACGNKLTTTEILVRNNIPTPRTAISFSAESAMDAIETVGYPCVMKPIVGSWGRQVVPLRDKETAEALIEMREQQNGDSTNSIFYIQELVKRPPRDIRCVTAGGEIVACVYRYSAPSSWKTNVALGGHTEHCQITSELEEIVSKTARVIGGEDSILGIDLMEPEGGGYVVHEVNGTVEFRGAQIATETSIAGSMAEFLIGKFLVPALSCNKREQQKSGTSACASAA